MTTCTIQRNETNKSTSNLHFFRNSVLPERCYYLVCNPRLLCSSGHRLIGGEDAMSICNEPNASQHHNA